MGLVASRCLLGILKQIVIKSIFIKNNKRSQLLFRLSVLKGNGMGYIWPVFIKTLYERRTCLCTDVRSWPNMKVAAVKQRQRCWAFTLLTVTSWAQEKGLWFLAKAASKSLSPWGKWVWPQNFEKETRQKPPHPLKVIFPKTPSYAPWMHLCNCCLQKMDAFCKVAFAGWRLPGWVQGWPLLPSLAWPRNKEVHSTRLEFV